MDDHDGWVEEEKAWKRGWIVILKKLKSVKSSTSMVGRGKKNEDNAKEEVDIWIETR
jgi:hypothetical protein